MLKTALSLAAISICFTSFGSGTAAAQSLIEPDYTHEAPLALTPWYEYGYSNANKAADMKFIIDMRPHHAGALSMVDEYYANGKGTSKRLLSLTKGIKHNQTFEISALSMVEGLIADKDFSRKQSALVATQGLAQNTMFVRLPMPPVQPIFAQDDVVSAEDVRFAKAMIVHHEGALMMAKDYLNDPNARNGYLQRLCLDILRDQEQEIALMHDIIDHYKGDASAIKITASMIHGMDGMMHHMDLSSVNGAPKSDTKAHHGQHGHHGTHH